MFKPDRDDDFNAPTAAVELRWTRPANEDADWEVGTGAAFEYRRFGGPALVTDCPPIRPDEGWPARAPTSDTTSS